MEIKVICGNCGELVKVSPFEIKGGKIILTLDEEHVCYDEVAGKNCSCDGCQGEKK